MKKIGAIFLLAVVLSSCSSGPSVEEALKYDDIVSEQFDMFSNVYSEYALRANSSQIQEQEDYRVYSCNQVIIFIDRTKKIGSFNDNSDYVNALLNYLIVTQKAMQENDGPKLQLLLKDSLMTKDDSIKVKTYTKQTLALTNDAYIKFISAQKKFREEYKLTELTQ